MKKAALVLTLLWGMFESVAAEDCASFMKGFKSVPISTAALSDNFLNEPLPATMRRWEAGYDANCAVGGVADVYFPCSPDDITLRLVRLIKNAPVIASDSDGFTVVVVSTSDHQKLAGQDVNWAYCHTPAWTVTSAIVAAREKDLATLGELIDFKRIAAHPRHGKTKAEMISFLRSIDPQKIRFRPPSNSTVRMLEPVNMDFDVERIERVEKVKFIDYVITGVHP